MVKKLCCFSLVKDGSILFENLWAFVYPESQMLCCQISLDSALRKKTPFLPKIYRSSVKKDLEIEKKNIDIIPMEYNFMVNY